MKILLVSPNFILNSINKKNIYGGSLPPLGLLSIASPLIKEGHNILLLEKLTPCNKSDLPDMVKFEQPDLIGFSVNSFMYIHTAEFIKDIKEDFPQIPIVVGGPHATAASDELLSNKHIDYVVRGEGELTCVDLVSKLETGASVSSVLGLSYKSKEKIIHNLNRPLIDDLDTLPFPAYDLLPKSSINHYGLHRETRKKPVLTIKKRGSGLSFCIICR